MTSIDILLFIEVFTFMIILGFTSFHLVVNERKRAKHQTKQEEIENTILEDMGLLRKNTDEILLKITQIEQHKAKLQKDLLKHDLRIDKTEQDILELFKIVAKSNNV